MLAALAAGCGGDSGETEPSLPAPVADDLAGRADAVADHLAAGDACAAAAEADDLLHASVAAIESGRVPPELQEELLGNAQALQSRIECPPEPQPPPPATAEPDDADDDDDDDEDEDEDDEDRRGSNRGRG